MIKIVSPTNVGICCDGCSAWVSGITQEDAENMAIRKGIICMPDGTHLCQACRERRLRE